MITHGPKLKHLLAFLNALKATLALAHLLTLAQILTGKFLLNPQQHLHQNANVIRGASQCYAMLHHSSAVGLKLQDRLVFKLTLLLLARILSTRHLFCSGMHQGRRLTSLSVILLLTWSCFNLFWSQTPTRRLFLF